MAVVAGIGAGNMGRVLANSDSAVMAGATCSNDLGVIDGHHRRENIGGVAVFTDVSRLDVRQVFAGCIGAVMTANTIASDVDVIEIRR